MRRRNGSRPSAGMTVCLSENAQERSRSLTRGLFINRSVLWIAAFAIGLAMAPPGRAQTVAGSSLNITGQSTLMGDAVMCSGHPWIDVRCHGAVGDGSHDDATAINTTIAEAITNNWPVHLAAGTYKISSPIIIDYAGQARQGFRLI